MKLHGVINASGDSLADFSIALDVESTVKRAKELIQVGCVGIDLGAAGSTQFASRIEMEEEWERLDGKIQAIAELGVELSVDTEARDNGKGARSRSELHERFRWHAKS